jgi:hypothetical protein
VYTRGDHRVRHPEPVEGCFGCHARTVRIGNQTTSPDGRRELFRRWQIEKEVTAYKDARAQGILPEGSQWPQIQEAIAKSRFRDEPYDAAADDGMKDWGDGDGDYERDESPVGPAPRSETVTIGGSS